MPPAVPPPKEPAKPMKLSPELAEFMGEESMSRPSVVKKVWAMIKERNLYVSLCNLFFVLSIAYLIDLFVFIHRTRKTNCTSSATRNLKTFSVSF